MLLPNIPQVRCSQTRLVQAVGGQVSLKHLIQPQVQQWCCHPKAALVPVAARLSLEGCWCQSRARRLAAAHTGARVHLAAGVGSLVSLPSVQCLQDMAGFVILFFLNSSQKASKVAPKTSLVGQLDLVLKSAKLYHKNCSKVVRKRGRCRSGWEGKEGPGAIALAPLATNPRRGYRPPPVCPSWHNGARGEAATGFVLLHFCCLFFF